MEKGQRFFGIFVYFDGLWDFIDHHSINKEFFKKHRENFFIQFFFWSPFFRSSRINLSIFFLFLWSLTKEFTLWAPCLPNQEHLFNLNFLTIKSFLKLLISYCWISKAKPLVFSLSSFSSSSLDSKKRVTKEKSS